MLKTVVRLLNTLVLVAGLLWSSVCVAQCRVLPGASKTRQTKKLPPCHKQPDQKDCPPDTCTASYADLEQQLQSADVSLEPAVREVIWLKPAQDFVSVLDQHRLPDPRPPDSTSILRI